MRYLKGTLDEGLVFKSAKNPDVKVIGYSDADWAGDAMTRKSTSGYLFQVCGGAVSWRSQRQPIVALSSTEAEYIATTVACKELVWLRNLLGDVGFKQVSPTVLHGDNQGAILLSKNPVHHDRTKHIDLRFHYIRERLINGEVDLRYCATDSMVADAMTKPEGQPRLLTFKSAAGIGK
jgi:hypothetical protein